MLESPLQKVSGVGHYRLSRLLSSLFVCCFLVALAPNSVAQKLRTWNIGFGGSNTFFQDVKQSDVRFGGAAGTFELARKAQSDKMWSEYQFGLNIGSQNPGTHSSASLSTFSTFLAYSYQKSLESNWFIGGRWDAFAYNIWTDGDGGNSSQQVVSSSKLQIAVSKALSLKDRPLQLSLDFGLLSFYREARGFGFSIPQKAQEDGDFSYQNESVNSTLSLRYSRLALPWKYFHLRFKADYVLSKRFVTSYRWQLERYATVPEYPTTFGQHTLMISYRFIHRQGKNTAS